MPTLQNGVSVLGSRWGGVSLFCARFALALRSLSRLRLFLFEARLSGYCVRGGESTLGSSCLPLARGSCRAVGFRQDECRPGASAWACCLWFVALLPTRGSWSSCVFAGSTVVAFPKIVPAKVRTCLFDRHVPAAFGTCSSGAEPRNHASLALHPREEFLLECGVLPCQC